MKPFSGTKTNCEKTLVFTFCAYLKSGVGVTTSYGVVGIQSLIADLILITDLIYIIFFLNIF